MDPIIARCGNRCDLCPLFKGNFNADWASAINEAIYKYHHRGQGPRPHYTVACDGCLSDGYRPRANCPIRACANDKSFGNCASCPEMYCQLLEDDMAVIEGALSTHAPAMPQADFERFFRPFLIREALAIQRGGQASQ